MFRCADKVFVKVIKNGRREVKNSLVRKWRMYMSQENVIKFGVALHPWFPHSYGVLRFSEQDKHFRISEFDLTDKWLVNHVAYSI